MTTLDAPKPDTIEALSPAERTHLEQCEGRISKGIGTFRDVGEAISEIITGRLYREQYATSDAYLAEKWGMTRQHANRLVSAAHTASVLEPIGLHPENERQARKLKSAAKIVEKLSPEDQIMLAEAIKTSTESTQPDTSQIRAYAETVKEINRTGTVEDPDSGEQVPWMELPPERRAVIFQENVSTNTYERTQRQKVHKAEGVLEAKANGRGGWTDWVMTYAQQSLTDSQEIRIVVKRDRSGNAKATALIVDTETHATIAFGDDATWLKQAVLNLAEEVKGI
ncbi:hypothetical protein [Deinococcus ruber]|uniref:Uncharacterized protein n=1 Tax=Deinococcus ruber TaxID=1848197 RepID=A0A918CN04_9DEIO|nr:hypothetical protein [Deinococcus ruber]GGR31288.1 hypothetical protein GCM10008957_47450 [Deinococcus ruber]